MTTGQKIYQAIELFSTEDAHFDQFKLTFRAALVDNGTPAANAEQMASIAAESLRDHNSGDYHLGMAQIITFDPAFERAANGSPEAVQAMHKYMSYYLDYAETQLSSAAN